MTWIKTIGSGLAVAVLGFLAFMAATRAGRESASAKKWKDRAVAEAEGDVEVSLDEAKATLSKAKLHDERARAAAKKTRERLDRIGAHDSTMADITSRWRKPK